MDKWNKSKKVGRKVRKTNGTNGDPSCKRHNERADVLGDGSKR